MPRHSPTGDESTFGMLKVALYACQHLGHSRPFAPPCFVGLEGPKIVRVVIRSSDLHYLITLIAQRAVRRPALSGQSADRWGQTLLRGNAGHRMAIRQASHDPTAAS
jgi:hypothetical protein